MLQTTTNRSSRARIGWVGLSLAVLGLAIAGGSCRGPRGPERAPTRQAELAFERAQAALAEAVDGTDLAPARAALEEALQADPEWLAPRRLLDDLARADLGAVDALEGYRAQLARDPARADLLYLAGRLEGAAGARRIAMAAAVDPRLPWPHHGVGVDREMVAGPSAAVAPARRAFERARGAFELSLFGRRLADLERAAGDPKAAREVLREAWQRVSSAAPGIDPDASPSALDLRLALARAELEAEDDVSAMDSGVQRALELIAGAELSDAQLADLIGRLPEAPPGRSRAWMGHFLADALAARGITEFAHDAVSIAAGVGALGQRLLEVAPDSASGAPDFSGSSVAQRTADFDAGRFQDGVLGWLERLPAAAVEADGGPRDARLAAVVAAAESLGEAPTSADLLQLARTTAAAGWIEESLAVTRTARALPTAAPADMEELAAIARHVSAWRSLLAEIDLAVGALQDRGPSLLLTPRQTPSSDVLGDRPDSLPDLMQRIEEAVERHRPGLEAWAGAAPLPDSGAIAQSPSQSFGPFADIAVPGPVFNERERLLGLGEPGEPVPGLAQLMHGFQRVGLFGKATGRPLDGSVLRLLAASQVAGEHLGVPYAGSLLLCEGTDADGSLARAGGGVSGAALHEGYWIDVEAERQRLARIERSHASFAQLDPAERTRLLDWRGPELRPTVDTRQARRIARAELRPALDGGDRVRLAMWAEAIEAGTDPVDLDDLLQLVFVHEEGHLCDRERFLPLGENFASVAGFALDSRLSPGRLEEQLEYRAELVALAEVEDPRLVLAELLDAARVDARRRGVHSRAYTRLLGDLLHEADRALANEPAEWPTLDPDHYLIYQLHHLTPGQVRTLARRLAERVGLAR